MYVRMLQTHPSHRHRCVRWSSACSSDCPSARAEQPSKRIVGQEIPVLSRVGNVVASERAAVLRPACVTYPQSAEIGTSEERCEVLLFHAEGWFQHNNIPPYLGHTHTYHQSVCSDCHDSFGTSAAVGKKTKWYKDSACHISDSLSPSRNVGPSKKSSIAHE